MVEFLAIHDPSKYCVISLTQGRVHAVQVFESGCIKCYDQLYRFNSLSTCAHSQFCFGFQNYVN